MKPAQKTEEIKRKMVKEATTSHYLQSDTRNAVCVRVWAGARA
jgi:hypothetical protein